MTDELTQAQIREFVLAGHGDLGKVKALLAAEPRLLNARYQEFDETALEAAAHVGNRTIAEYLLAQGAPLTICAAAMLGQRVAVQGFLSADSHLAHSSGAHGISLLYHAAQSGDTAITDLLEAYGNTQDPSQPLHGAVNYGRTAMVRWLLARGANIAVLNFQGQTPLQVAEALGHEEIAALLRQHEAG